MPTRDRPTECDQRPRSRPSEKRTRRVAPIRRSIRRPSGARGREFAARQRSEHGGVAEAARPEGATRSESCGPRPAARHGARDTPARRRTYGRQERDPGAPRPGPYRSTLDRDLTRDVQVGLSLEAARTIEELVRRRARCGGRGPTAHGTGEGDRLEKARHSSPSSSARGARRAGSRPASSGRSPRRIASEAISRPV
jgi:hypothetical protein